MLFSSRAALERACLFCGRQNQYNFCSGKNDSQSKVVEQILLRSLRKDFLKQDLFSI